MHSAELSLRYCSTVALQEYFTDIPSAIQRRGRAAASVQRRIASVASQPSRPGRGRRASSSRVTRWITVLQEHDTRELCSVALLYEQTLYLAQNRVLVRDACDCDDVMHSVMMPFIFADFCIIFIHTEF